MAKTSKYWPDRGLLVATLLMASVGLVMVFSASAGMSEERFGSAYLFLRKQLLWDALGLIVLFFFVCVSITTDGRNGLMVFSGCHSSR